MPLMATMKRLNLLAAVIDQVFLSLLSFGISLAFILATSKTEYGYYLLLLAPLLLVQGVQNAIINSPLATFLPASDENHKYKLRRTAVSLHIFLAFAAAGIGLVGLATYEYWAGRKLNIMLLTGFSVAVIGTISREAQRSLSFVQGQGVQAFMGDLAYGAALFMGIAWATLGDNLTAGIALLLTGIAGTLPLLAKLSKFEGIKIYPETISQLWSCGRWALPSVIVTWANLSAYPYFAENALGLAAVADIGAARLFFVPVGLLVTAWSNWYRPRISAWMSLGDIDAVKRITHQSLFGGWVAISVFAVLISTTYPLIESALGKQYIGLESLVLMWFLFFALNLARNIYMATLMTNAQGYKILHHITWLAMALSLPGFVLFSDNGTLWIVGVLCAIELVQSVLIVVKTGH